MANISISSSKVKSTLTSIDTTYQSLELTLSEMENKKNELSQHWNSKEATAFFAKLSELSNHVADFKKKYSSFTTFINDVLDTYGTSNNDLISTINTITAKASGEGNNNQ